MRNPAPPPTWREACDAAQELRRLSGEKTRQLKDYLGRLSAADAAIRQSTEGLLVQSEAEWKHWNGYHAKAAAFVRVHPAMERESIYAKKCGHEGAFAPGCYTGPDDGWYREPAAPPRQAEPPASFYEKEPGDDDF